MQLHGTIIEDTHAEAFPMWACRLVVTAADDHWLHAAVAATTGYGTSIIGCDAEVGLERYLPPDETPDRRRGAAILLFARGIESLADAVGNRTGQCVMTCPTTAAFDGLPGLPDRSDAGRIDLGNHIQYFGDQHQRLAASGDRQIWHIPVMEGEFLVEDTAGAVRAIGGGNFLICGVDQPSALAAARRAVEAIAPLPQVITPFPGGVVRCGSKVGSRYRGVPASTNDAFCPTLRHATETRLRESVRCVYEVVIDGLSRDAVAGAMRAGIAAACGPGIVAISAGNYGGKLGDICFDLHPIMKGSP